MSSDVERKVVIFPSYDSIKEELINLKEIVIPFSKFKSSRSIEFIYYGNETIRFKKSHPVYRKLLFDEFHS
jgi:hypothetical protein